jgi:hypothetical protein
MGAIDADYAGTWRQVPMLQHTLKLVLSLFRVHLLYISIFISKMEPIEQATVIDPHADPFDFLARVNPIQVPLLVFADV